VNLKTFVAESLKQIIDGVVEAQEYAEEKGAKVNPKGRSSESSEYIYKDASGDIWNGQNIEFDVAVEAMEGDTAEGGIGVLAGVFNIGAKGKTEEMSSQVSRIRFSVSVFFPEQK
jgi:hypothetical protein